MRKSPTRLTHSSNPPLEHLPVNPYTPVKICGADYFVIDQQNLGVKTATVYVLHSNQTGFNCVVTLKWENVGEPALTDARLRVDGDTEWTVDRREFSYYVGPVKLEARAKCIRWGFVARTPPGVRLRG